MLNPSKMALPVSHIKSLSPPDPVENFLAESEKSFPNIIVSELDQQFRGAIQSGKVAGHPIARLKTTGLTASASKRKGVDAGLKGWAKLVWQISGSSKYQDDNAAFELREGDAVVLPMAEQYQLEMQEGYDGLMMIFDPSARTGWSDLMQGEIRPISGNAAVAASGAAMAAMLKSAVGDVTDHVAVDFALDIILRCAADSGSSNAEMLNTARLRRAAWLIEQNLSDFDYTPSEIARDLGMSRRALYQEFARAGLSPAKFAMRMRLDRAKRDVLNNENSVTLTDIALKNGFTDSSSFSHAFKRAFGAPPSSMRAVKGAK